LWDNSTEKKNDDMQWKSVIQKRHLTLKIYRETSSLAVTFCGTDIAALIVDTQYGKKSLYQKQDAHRFLRAHRC
jgi:hypothetical protein